MDLRALNAIGACCVAPLLSLGLAQHARPEATPASPVSVDFRVISNDGEPVADVRPSEIRLKVGGRERRIESLELISLDRTPRETLSPARRSPLPHPFAVSSAVDPRGVRHIMLVLDEASLHAGQEQHLRTFVSDLLSSLSPHDDVGLLTFGTANTEIAFTTRHDVIRAAVNAIALGQATSGCHPRVVMRMLRAAIDRTPQGMSSAVLVISAPRLTPPTPPVAGTSIPSSPRCTLTPVELADVRRAVARSQTHVYVQGHNELATAIGAETAPLTGGDASVVTRILRETRAYYRVTFARENEKPEDLHRLELRVDRPNVRVRAPSQITIPSGSTSRAGNAPPGTSAAGLLQLRATAAPAQHSGEKIKLLAIFEPVDPGAPLTESTVAVSDERGETVAQSTLRPADLRQRPIVAALAVPPATYRVRISAADSAGRRATVDDVIHAVLNATGAASTSGLLLGTNENGAFAPRLVFAGETTAVAYLEIYGTAPSDEVTVVYELADSIDGPARTALRGEVRAGSNGARVAIADIPLGAIGPGDVLVRAAVRVNGAPAATIFRTLRKTGS